MSANDELKSYLLVADTTQGNLDELIAGLDRAPEFVNWYKFMPGAIALVSPLDVNEADARLRELFPRRRHLLVRLERGTKNGWLPRSAWQFMNEPSAA